MKELRALTPEEFERAAEKLRNPAPGSRIEETQRYFGEVESAIYQIVGRDQISVILDNIGLPYSGMNIALSDSATVGPMAVEVPTTMAFRPTPRPSDRAG